MVCGAVHQDAERAGLRAHTHGDPRTRGVADGVAQRLLDDAERGDLHGGGGRGGGLAALQQESDLDAGAADAVDQGRDVVDTLLGRELGTLVLGAEHTEHAAHLGE